MKRMKFHHHKYALTITIVFIAIIGVLLGVQVDQASADENALLILLFGFMMVLLVLGFISISVILRTREELHELHAELAAKIEGKKKK